MDYESGFADWHRLLLEAGLYRGVRFEGASLEGLKLLVTPLMPYASPEFLARVERFVRAGGIWICGPVTGTRTGEHTVPTDGGRGEVGTRLLARRVAQRAHSRQHRGLQPGEREIEVARMQQRPRQLERCRVAALGQSRKLGAAGVAQAEQLGRFVEGLAGGVVDRLAEHPVAPQGGDVEQHRVPARHEQRNEGEIQRRVRQQRRQQMTFEVVHAQQRPVGGQRQRRGQPGTDQQRAGQTGTLRVGDHVDVAQRAAGVGQRALHQRQRARDVVARRQLRDDAAVIAVHRDLRVQRVGEQPVRAVVDCHAGLVARRFQAEHAQRHRVDHEVAVAGG
ncbi:beta-galactosidase YesZ [mine drainage metagenome]|uniref:Beta-galactosidase YesZ n=1 Tax=mine drainage metagenome TaxID=410659 RepID=A0A1J5QN92_9ZZZZ